MKQQASVVSYFLREIRSGAHEKMKNTMLSVQYQRIVRVDCINGKGFHSLHHAAAMLLAQAGKTPVEIGNMLRHVKTESVKNRHVPWLEWKRQAAASL